MKYSLLLFLAFSLTAMPEKRKALESPGFEQQIKQYKSARSGLWTVLKELNRLDELKEQLPAEAYFQKTALQLKIDTLLERCKSGQRNIS